MVTGNKKNSILKKIHPAHHSQCCRLQKKLLREQDLTNSCSNAGENENENVEGTGSFLGAIRKR